MPSRIKKHSYLDGEINIEKERINSGFIEVYVRTVMTLLLRSLAFHNIIYTQFCHTTNTLNNLFHAAHAKKSVVCIEFRTRIIKVKEQRRNGDDPILILYWVFKSANSTAESLKQ